MLSKNQLKWVKKLHLSKFRQEESLFLAEGVKVVDELIQSQLGIHHIFATEKWLAENVLPDNRSTVQITVVSQDELAKISTLQSPNQVLAIGQIPENASPESTAGEWVLLLDQLADPGNLGTIIRTADWFGFDRVLAAFHSVELWNPKVVQASMGSIFRLPVHYVDPVGFLVNNAGKLPVYGTLLMGEPVHQMTFSNAGIVLIGNESRGISDVLKPYITHKITIAPFSVSPQGHAESLNASIATAVICYEVKKQAQSGKKLT